MVSDMIDKKRLTELFLELVRIKSPSGDEKEIVEKVSSILAGLGLEVDIDDTGKKYGSNSGNITAFLKGTANDGRQPIFL